MLHATHMPRLALLYMLTHAPVVTCVWQFNLDTFQGPAVRRARNVNTKFILEQRVKQRADMRVRLVKLAMEGELQHGQAKLNGFADCAAFPEAVIIDDSE